RDAERYIQDAIDTLTALQKRAPNDEEVQRGLAADYRNLANTLRLASKTKAGIAAGQEAEKLWARLAQNNPKDPYFRKHQAITLHILALLHEDQKDSDRAGEAFTRALAIHTALADSYPSLGTYQDDLAGTYGNFGLYQARIGQRDKAIEFLKQSV